MTKHVLLEVLRFGTELSDQLTSESPSAGRISSPRNASFILPMVSNKSVTRPVEPPGRLSPRSPQRICMDHAPEPLARRENMGVGEVAFVSHSRFRVSVILFLCSRMIGEVLHTGRCLSFCFQRQRVEFLSIPDIHPNNEYYILNSCFLPNSPLH